MPASAAGEERRDGGSIVRTARRFSDEEEEEDAATVTASTASATANSACVGSKNILSPTEITSKVIGGRDVAVFLLGGFDFLLEVEEAG